MVRAAREVRAVRGGGLDVPGDRPVPQLRCEYDLVGAVGRVLGAGGDDLDGVSLHPLVDQGVGAVVGALGVLGRLASLDRHHGPPASLEGGIPRALRTAPRAWPVCGRRRTRTARRMLAGRRRGW